VKASTVVPSPGPDADAEALIKEARRRQRRRQLMIGLAAAAVLAGALGSVAGLRSASPHGPGRPPTAGPRPKPAASKPGPRAGGPIPRSVDSTVLMWPVGYPGFTAAGGPPSYFDDLSAGRVSQRQNPAISAGDYRS
jgi:hypothetical protein